MKEADLMYEIEFSELAKKKQFLDLQKKIQSRINKAYGLRVGDYSVIKS